jgi:hypothetical protein
LYPIPKNHVSGKYSTTRIVSRFTDQNQILILLKKSYYYYPFKAFTLMAAKPSMETMPLSGMVTVIWPLSSVVPRDAPVVESITFALARGAEVYVKFDGLNIQDVAVKVAESPEWVAVKDTGVAAPWVVAVQMMMLSLAATGVTSSNVVTFGPGTGCR